MLASRALMVAACAALVLVAGTAQPANTGSTSSRARQFELQHIGMQQWFNKMDVSRDGQLQEGELRQFIGAQLGPTEFNTGKKLDQAVEQVRQVLHTGCSVTGHMLLKHFSGASAAVCRAAGCCRCSRLTLDCDRLLLQATEHIDSTDSGTTISLPELDEHLLKVLEVRVQDTALAAGLLGLAVPA